MAPTRILVVEDESIIAENIYKKLNDLGYVIVATVSTGEEAIEKAEELRPDLILMDIGLAGKIDGVAAAGRIRSRFDIPVIYLTAYAEEETLERAKITEPAGFLIKPFERRELRTTIETSLYKHQTDHKLRASEARLRAIFDFAGIAIALLSPDGHWLEVNRYWTQLMGYTIAELQPLSLLDLTHPADAAATGECMANLLAGRLDYYRLEKRYLHKNGHAIWVDVSVTPIRGKNNEITALITAVTDITRRKEVEGMMQDSVEKLKMAYKQTQLYAEDLTRDITRRKQAEEAIQQLNLELEQRVTDRMRELAALYDVTAVASEFLDLETTLTRLLGHVLKAMRSTVGAIHLLDNPAGPPRLAAQQNFPPHLAVPVPADTTINNSSLVQWIIVHNEPLIVPDLIADPRVTQRSGLAPGVAYVGVPIRARGQVRGVLSVLKQREQSEFNMDEITLLAAIADHVGVVVESGRLRQLAEQAAIIEERSRLARDLHDSVTQLLYSSILLAEVGRESYHKGDLTQVNQCLSEIGDIVRQSLKEMRLLVYELRPPTLEQEGLVGALQHRLDAVEGRAGVIARLLADETLVLPGPLAEELYHIAQEALNNALKHAAATTITVKLDSSDQIELEITDNGRGFNPNAINHGGLGLTSMRERATKLGGKLTITTAPGQGTQIKVKITNYTPLAKPVA